MDDVKKIKIHDDDETIEIKPISVEIKEEAIELKTVELSIDKHTALRYYLQHHVADYSIKAMTNIVYRGKRGTTTLDNALIYISLNAKWEHVFRLSKALSRYKAAKIIAEHYDAVDDPDTEVCTCFFKVALFHDDTIYVITNTDTLIWLPDFPHDIYYHVEYDKPVRGYTDVAGIIKFVLLADARTYDNLYDAIKDDMARRIMFDDNKRLVLDIDLLA